MNIKTLKIASRNSPLALVQSETIKQHLTFLYPNLAIEILPMTTEGDRRLNASLANIGGKGLFVKELEQAMLEGKADIAVHSAKDMPISLPNGLSISVFYKREDARDVLISNSYRSLDNLPVNAVIGTSSLRRQSLIKSIRPDLQVKNLRGNLQTRLQKLDAKEFDAIILAAAGLWRLGLEHRITEYLEPEIFTPAATQGTLCIETRSNDAAIIELLQPLHHPVTAVCALAERAMNIHLQGGCQVPIGAYATLQQQQLITLHGFVGSADGQVLLRAKSEATINHAEQLGINVAEQLLAAGAKDLLKNL